jgi:hypothetical protein
VGKLLKRERLNCDEIIFVFFGALSAPWTVHVVYVSLIVWRARMVDCLRAVVSRRGDPGAVFVNALLILLALSFLALMGLIPVNRHQGVGVAVTVNEMTLIVMNTRSPNNRAEGLRACHRPVYCPGACGATIVNSRTASFPALAG